MCGDAVVCDCRAVVLLVVLVADLRRSDTADYECRAASETGLTPSRAARLSVDAPSSGAVEFRRSPRRDTFPAPPGRPSAADVTNTSVKLAWRAPGNVGASPLSAYVVEYFSHVIGQVRDVRLIFLLTRIKYSLSSKRGPLDVDPQSRTVFSSCLCRRMPKTRLTPLTCPAHCCFIH